MKLLHSKISYIILFLLIISIVLIINILKNNKVNDISINFFASGNLENMSCLSLYINDENKDDEYSFDSGISWQKSNYGALYQNGENTILVRNNQKEIIFNKKVNINYLTNNGPMIKMDFDASINNKNEKELLKGISASSNGKNILSKVKTNILESSYNKALVSYLVEDNDNVCYLLRNVFITNNEENTVISNKWQWPTQKPYKISRIYGKYNGKMHNGIDIYGLKRGTPIYAARDGQVVVITSNSSSGYYVTIKHDNGYYTRYAHMQNVAGNDKLNLVSSATKYVSIGDRIKANDIIGEIGSSGNSTGLHLHFEIWDGKPYESNSYDPLKFY